ncbi:MAG: methylenetetrahydrofolate--tRNA-(uracil(54)-C(5))-methyltransferase (FADH(2)-oxidizing) TrmFO [Nitrospirae bacterium]|nr:methylenetetrahydrofolate--tRNA-(uracil(54)-C(5))-methyltransferase (FADH(2)-oxidizing) TrmFO [Nitrospirota bacterium]MBF0593270.1 methylenetetrahydrofolate--tRNA-(uracil(54)-C(5))-methyltransferase (FADH(2)-oxidizing) TrmFO [Nitrospirota bacterium]
MGKAKPSLIFFYVIINSREMSRLTIIGGGLAGSEAAYQAACLGVDVTLYEMRPLRLTPAHKTGLLGELVCSNSLRSDLADTAHGLLKAELTLANSLIMEAARATAIPAGSALAVNREEFATYITNRLKAHPHIRIVTEEVTALPAPPAIIATGPLTSDALAAAISKVTGDNSLYFYDAIAPIIDADSIDYDLVYYSSRYGKGGDDYLNCPMDEPTYNRFYDALTEADSIAARDFEDVKVFEGCMPIEVMALRGKDTLRFGPLRPVGLPHPRTGEMMHAVVQLRAENAQRSAFNMVGFQTRLRQSQQQRVFRLIPGLQNAEFLRYGSIHRNTFINSPLYLDKSLRLRCGCTTGSTSAKRSSQVEGDIYVAGQLTGVEGYLESTAMGLLAGIFAARQMLGLPHVDPPADTACGALLAYITNIDRGASFQPSNINFGLLPPLDKHIRDRNQKKQALVARALQSWRGFQRLNDNG